MIILKCTILAAMLLIATCDETKKISELTKDQNGDEITLSKNQAITITLDSNPTTGYTWALTDSNSQVIKQLQKSQFQASSKKLMGAPGKQIFHFQAQDSGQTELKLIYHRPWEKDTAPADTFSVKIKVVE